MCGRPGQQWSVIGMRVRSSVTPAMVPSCPSQVIAPAGEFVTEMFDYDRGRQVTAYLPPDPPEAVVFTGDGQVLSQWGADLETAELPPTLIVGVHRLTDETLRLHEYSPGFDPSRFTAHETFFVDDVRRWTKSRFAVALPPERTAVLGVSAGGELALAMGLRHPDIYGAIFCASRLGIPTARRHAHAVAEGVLRRRNRGAVFPRERVPVGSGIPGSRRGRRDDRASRITRRPLLAPGVPENGRVGVRVMRQHDRPTVICVDLPTTSDVQADERSPLRHTRFR
jgi:hypothetical protein